MSMSRTFVKITIQDLEIAETFFENEKHFNEWLVNVFRYYRGQNVKIKTKIVSKYFETYKKTMDYVMQASNNGKKANHNTTEKQQVTNSTLAGSSQGVLRDPETTLSTNNKVISNKDKVKVKTKEKKEVFNFRKSLLEYGFEENLVDDWLKVRKAKRATNTKTAYTGFINQVKKTNINFDEVLRICIEKSWQGFNASWLLPVIKNNTPAPEQKSVAQEAYERGERAKAITRELYKNQ